MAVQLPRQMSQLSHCQAEVPGVQAMPALSLETNDPPAWIPASCCHSRAAPPPTPPALGPDSSAISPTLPEETRAWLVLGGNRLHIMASLQR